MAAERYAPKIYRPAFYHLRDAALAEDPGAEVLARMLAAVERSVMGRGAFQP